MKTITAGALNATVSGDIKLGDVVDTLIINKGSTFFGLVFERLISLSNQNIILDNISQTTITPTTLTDAADRINADFLDYESVRSLRSNITIYLVVQSLIMIRFVLSMLVTVMLKLTLLTDIKMLLEALEIIDKKLSILQPLRLQSTTQISTTLEKQKLLNIVDLKMDIV